MTDRVRALTVTLEREMRDDDVQVVVDAIKMIKYVHDVDFAAVGMDERIASSDFSIESAGLLVDVIHASCRVGFGSDESREFLATVKSACETLRNKRGY